MTVEYHGWGAGLLLDSAETAFEVQCRTLAVQFAVSALMVKML